MSQYKCDKCGARAKAQVNGRAYLCQECITEFTEVCMMRRLPVLHCVRGESLFLTVPSRQGPSRN